MKDPNLSKKFLFCTKEEKKWVLEYLSSGKGTIPYELISDFDSLSIAPDDEFCKPHQFYSSMKDSVLSKDEYENVKKFIRTLNFLTFEMLIKYTVFKTLSFFAKYLNNDLTRFKKCLNLILVIVTVQAPLVAVFTETKASAVLLFPLTLNMSELLKKL